MNTVISPKYDTTSLIVPFNLTASGSPFDVSYVANLMATVYKNGNSSLSVSNVTISKPSGASIGEYNLTIPYSELAGPIVYLTVEIQDRDSSIDETEFVVIVRNPSNRIKITHTVADANTTTIKIPFVIESLNPAFDPTTDRSSVLLTDTYLDGEYCSNASSTIRNLYHNIYELSIPLSNIKENMTYWGQFTCDEYIDILIYEDGNTYGIEDQHIVIRLLSLSVSTNGGGSSGSNGSVLTSSDISDIAQAVWQYTTGSGRHLTSTTIDSYNTIESKVWEYTSGSGRHLTSEALSSGYLAKLSDLSNIGGSNNNNSSYPSASTIAQEVWNYNTGYGRTLTSLDVGNDTIASSSDINNISITGSYEGLTSEELEAIADAVWGRNSGDTDRMLTTAELDNYSGDSLAITGAAMTLTTAYDAAKTAAPTTTAIANAVWGRSSTSSSTDRTLTSLNASDIAEAVWDYDDGYTGRTLTESPTDLSEIATKTDLTNAKQAVLDRGNAAWKTATGFAIAGDIPVSTINAINTAVEALHNTDLTGIATESDLATLQAAIVDAIPTVGEIWGRSSGDTTSRAITNAPDISSLATKTDVSTAKEAILTRGNDAWVTATGYATPSDIPAMISATDIATEVWSSSNRNNFINSVLTKDVGELPVSENGYTLKHLIMASQKSQVVSVNGETQWIINDSRLDGNNEPVVIATRVLTLNDNGAITKTE